MLYPVKTGECRQDRADVHRGWGQEGQGLAQGGHDSGCRSQRSEDMEAGGSSVTCHLLFWRLCEAQELLGVPEAGPAKEGLSPHT